MKCLNCKKKGNEAEVAEKWLLVDHISFGLLDGKYDMLDAIDPVEFWFCSKVCLEKTISEVIDFLNSKKQE